MNIIKTRKDYTPEQIKGYVIFSLLYKNYLTHETIAQQLNLDIREVLESIKEVKEYFLSLGLQIMVDNEKGLSLKADEESKRKILAMIIEETAMFKKEFLEEAKWECFEEIKDNVHFGLMNYYLSNELEISSEQVRTLENKVVIAHYRTSGHYHLELEEGWEKVLPIASYQKYYKIFIDIKNRYDLSLTDQDIVTFIRYILLHHHSIMKDMVSGEKVEAVVGVMLEKLYEDICLDFRKDEIMKESLKQHIKSLIIAQFTKEFSSNPLLKQIKKQYPLSFDLARYAKPILEKELSVLLSDDELGFLALHFEVGMHRYMHKHLHAILIGQQDDPKTILLKKTIEDHVYPVLRIDDIVEFNAMDSTSLVTKHLIIDPTKSYVNHKIDIVPLDYLPSEEAIDSFKETIQDYYHKTLPTFVDVEIEERTLDNDTCLETCFNQLPQERRKDSHYGNDYVVKIIDDSISENEMVCVKANHYFMINGDPYTALLVLKMKPDQNSIVSGYHSLKKWINRK